MDIKFKKAQLSKIIESCRFIGKTLANMMSNLGKRALIDLAVLFAKDVSAKLATKATSTILYKFERKISRKCVVRAGKGFTLFISNEDIDDIIKTVESLEKSDLLIGGATETVKHEIKNQEGGFLRDMMSPMAASLIAPMASSLIQPAASSLINALTGTRQEGGFLPLLALLLMMKVLGKGIRRAGRVYNNM